MAVEVRETTALPDVGFVPLHPPEAVQLVVFTDNHVSVIEPPPAGRDVITLLLASLAVNDFMTGGSAFIAIAVTESLAEPPAPETLYVATHVHPTMEVVTTPEFEPEELLATHGPLPQDDGLFDVYEELQLVPFVELQLHVYAWPTGTDKLWEAPLPAVVSVMVKVAVGAGGLSTHTHGV